MQNLFILLQVILLVLAVYATPLRAQTGTAPDSATVLEWIESARALRATGLEADTDSARILLRRAIAVAPTHEAVLVELFDTYFGREWNRGHSVAWYDTAAVYARRLAQYRPTHGLYLLGRVYGRKGEQLLALETLKQATQHDSTHVLANVHLGSRYFQLGQHDKVIPVLQRVLRYDSLSVGALQMSGYAYFHLGLPDHAEPMFHRSLAIDTTAWSAGGLLLTYLMREDYPTAIAFTEGLWQADTTVAWRWARAGEAHLFARNYAEAARFFAGALARDSVSYNNYVTRSSTLPLAYLRHRAGEEEEVAALMARAYAEADALLEVGQEPWNSYYQYASLALLKGDQEGALRWLLAAHGAGMPGPVLVETDPLFDDLRGDPKFEEILIRLRWRARALRAGLGYAEQEQ